MLSCSFVDPLELVVLLGHVDGPAELLPLRLVVDLLDGDVELLAPGHGDAGVEVVELARAKGDRLVLLLVDGLERESNVYLLNFIFRMK